MQIGELYKIKKIWFLYPNKELLQSKGARSVARANIPSFAIMESMGISKFFGCDIDCVFEDAILVVIEKDNQKVKGLRKPKNYAICKIITTNGQSGWIKIDDYNRTCFSLKT